MQSNFYRTQLQLLYYNLKIQANQNQNKQHPQPPRGGFWCFWWLMFTVLPSQTLNTATNDRAGFGLVGFLSFKIRPQNIWWSVQKTDWGIVPLHIPCSAASACLQQAVLHCPPRWCFLPQGNNNVAKILSNYVLSSTQKYLSFLYYWYKTERNYIYQKTSRVCTTKGKLSKHILDPETPKLHMHPHSLCNMHTKRKMSLTGNMLLRTAIYGCAKGGSSKGKQRILSSHLQLLKFSITILPVCLLLSSLCISSRKIKKLRKRNPTAFHNLSDSGNTFTIDVLHQWKKMLYFVLIFLSGD